METAVPSKRNPIRAAWRLLRPVNGGITFAAVLSMAYIAEAPASRLPDVLFAAAAAFFAASFGNALNDLLDLPIDRVNRPDRPLPSGELRPFAASVVAWCCAAAALVCGHVAGGHALPFVTAAVVLIALYDLWLKRIPGAGNAAVALLTSAAFLLGGIAAGNAGAALFPALFAFLINFARETAKDALDIPGDSAAGIRTLPSILGTKGTRLLLTITAGILIFSSYIPYLLGTYSSVYFIAVSAGVNIPLAYAVWYLYRTSGDAAFARASAICKYAMIAGLAAIIAGV